MPSSPNFHLSTNRFAHYLGAVALVVLFAGLQWFLINTFKLRLTYLMFFPPIMLSAWFGGWRVAMVASVLATSLAHTVFSPSYQSVGPPVQPQFWTTLIFFCECLFISALGEARLQSRFALLDERNLLEQRVAERTKEILAANQELAAQIAEREKAQIALTDSESKFRSVVETASDAIVMSDVEGKIIFWNRGAQEMFGYKADEVLHQPVVQLIPAEFQEAHTNAMRRLSEGASPRLLGRPLELRGRRLDDSEFPLELSLAAWETGGAQFYSGIMRDLSQRKQAEEDRLRLVEEMSKRAELEAAEQHYRLLAEATPQIVWTALPDGSVDYFNEHWFEFTGLNAEQSLGWQWQQIIHPDDRQRTIEVWRQATASLGEYEIEYRFRRYDGVYHWHLGRALPLRDDEGRIYKWFGTSTDIDTQKSTEEASRFLAQAMARLTGSLNEAEIVRALANLCAPSLGNWCVIDLVETVENEPQNHLGELLATPPVLRRAAIAGSPLENGLSSYEAPPKVERRGPWRALSSRRAEMLRGAEIEPLTQKGAIFEAWHNELRNSENSETCLTQPCTLFSVPLIARGRALGVLTIISTDADHNPDEIDAGIIEDLARNGALMIDNARLLHETQEANRAKDEFLAVLSHELRTPLTAILGWVQLLKNTRLDDNTRQRALDTIERNTHAQVQLIEDLLDLSRIVTGKLRLDMQPLNLEPVIEGALDAVRPAAQAKEIDLFLSISPEAEFVMGDAHRLQQGLWNLLANAVKFTPKGGRIEVSMRGVESYVEIMVRDNGKGITKDFLPFVFDRFRQADSSSTRQHGGLGLGLAIVRHVAELHGGTVQVESEGENKGTTFKMLLPISPLLADTGPRSGPLQLPETLTPIESANLLDGVRVLLVDDERDTREMLSAALRRYGAQVQTCSSAREALVALPDWQPRVLVSDIGMPTEDGYDLIRQVRTLSAENGGQIPAMALTAYARSTDRERALQAGFDRHVVKPVDPAILASHVADLAGESRN